MTHPENEDVATKIIYLRKLEHFRKIIKTQIKSNPDNIYEVDWPGLVIQIVALLQEIQEHLRELPSGPNYDEIKLHAQLIRKELQINLSTTSILHPAIQTLLDSYVESPITKSVEAHINKELEQFMEEPRERVRRAQNLELKCSGIEKEIVAFKTFYRYHVLVQKISNSDGQVE